ncbi:hypothetical protein [Nostoc sp. 2RC]|uniref:hypothetical protein n=1 Tax=Nostoc sp. 2RC TaxID=2485484 RepID=UPI0016260E3C|nr:hypothetical protein [Nostoc sp. 2RC]MBC1238585.1 hypothetical protein [Nostoc sp. 2RC]
MRLVERHIIKQNNKWFREIDKMSFLSKNLFNCAVYLCRQAFFKNQPIPTLNKIYHSLKNSDDYKALPSKVAQLVFKQVDKRSKSGKIYSADLNGSLNILRKVVGDSIFDRNSIERLVVSPVRLTPYQARNI